MARPGDAPPGSGSDTADIEASIADLYGGPLASFVARRDALARTLRSAGRRDEATRVKALRKPKAAAWALDAGGHVDPASVSELASAVHGVTEAQAGGGDVRAAIARLRAAESALVTAAGEATERHDHPVDATMLAAALRAVVGDSDAMAALTAGRLVDTPGAGATRATSPRAATSAGSRPPTTARAPAPAPEPREQPAPRRDTASIAAARRAVAAAERVAKAAATTARRAASAADAADRAAREAEARAATARRRADQALDAARRARSDADTAAATRDDADSEVAAAHDALRALRR